MDKVELYCNKCNKTFTQDVKYYGDIEWVCPYCKSSEDTFLRKYVEENPNNTKISLGKGGCGRTG